MNNNLERRFGRDVRLRAVELIALALDEVDANGGLPMPGNDTSKKQINSFKELVLQYAQNTHVSEDAITEMLDKPLSSLADELIIS